MSWAKCTECDETFTGDKWFDRHRINMTGKPGYDAEYDWRCATPEEMTARGWAQTPRGWWQGDPGRPHWTRPVTPRKAPKAKVAS